MVVSVIDLHSDDELWNGSRRTLNQRMGYFMENDLLSDMTFLVGEEKIRVPGHKFILSSCSWEFYNALHLLQVDNDELPIEDVSHDSFLLFLRYCYTGSLDFTTVEDSTNILKLAYRFDMKPLIEECEEKMLQMIESENCIQFYRQCDFLPENSPVKIKIIKVLAVNFLNSSEEGQKLEGILNLPLKAVEKIVKLDPLPCDEVKTFEALMFWSNHACEKAGIAQKPKNLRKILRYVFYRIRFPVMPIEMFMKILINYPDMLSGKEISTIIQKITTGKSQLLCPFFSVKRETDEQNFATPWPQLGTMKLEPTCSIKLTDPSCPARELCELEVNFKTRVEKKLSGFALIGNEDFTISLDIHVYIPCKACTVTVNTFCPCFLSAKRTTYGKRFRLSYRHAWKDFFIYPIFFDEELVLNPGTRYRLMLKSPFLTRRNCTGFLDVAVKNATSPESDLEILETPTQIPIIPFLYLS